MVPTCAFHSGKVILASTKAVYVLVPLPLERQIQDLLASHRVEEALTLTEGAQRNIPKDKFQVTECALFLFLLQYAQNMKHDDTYRIKNKTQPTLVSIVKY